MSGGVHVVLSSHALERLEERWPGEPIDQLSHRARVEISNAFDAGRVARHLPRLVVPSGRRPALSRVHGRRRFAWTPAGDLVAVVRRLPHRDGRGRREVLVLTVWPPTLVEDFRLEVLA